MEIAQLATDAVDGIAADPQSPEAHVRVQVTASAATKATTTAAARTNAKTKALNGQAYRLVTDHLIVDLDPVASAYLMKWL